jgi:hypothetical protein
MVLEKAEKKGWKCMSGAEFEVGLVSLLQTRLGELTGSTSNSKRLRLQWMKRSLSAFKLLPRVVSLSDLFLSVS